MENFLKQMTLHEGLRLMPYRCPSGKLTIGIGHNLDANGITKEVARLIFDQDTARFLSEVITALPWAADLDEVRQRVLVDMAWNMGTHGLLGFKRMLAAVERGEWAEASREMLDSRWASQVGRRASTLARMMETGDDPFD